MLKSKFEVSVYWKDEHLPNDMSRQDFTNSIEQIIKRELPDFEQHGHQAIEHVKVNWKRTKDLEHFWDD